MWLSFNGLALDASQPVWSEDWKKKPNLYEKSNRNFYRTQKSQHICIEAPFEWLKIYKKNSFETMKIHTTNDVLKIIHLSWTEGEKWM